MNALPRPVILFDGDDIPDVIARGAARLGAEICPNIEFLHLNGPSLMVGAFHRADAAFSAGYGGFVEYRAADPLCPVTRVLLDAVAMGGLCLSASTQALMEQDMVQAFCAAVKQRFPASAPMMVELAVAEAMGNAVIHGNLGLKSDLRHSLDGLSEFNARIEQSLADPTLAGRRVTMTALPFDQGGVEIIVSDNGDGFDFDQEMNKPCEAAAKSGRGLGLIRKVCSELSYRDAGTTLVMRFYAPSV